MLPQLVKKLKSFFGVDLDGSSALDRFAYVRHSDGTTDGSYVAGGGLSGPDQGARLYWNVTTPLGGNMVGFDMRIRFEMTLASQNDPQLARVHYDSSSYDEDTILTLAEDVSSWEVGDKIAVGSTDFDQDFTEEFQIVACSQCSSNQVKVNRKATYTHWGRVDFRSGIDQRAPVGLLSRNIKIQGQTGHACQYARTRESQNEHSVNYGRDFCQFFDGSNNHNQYQPRTGDMHGGHIIVTGGFKSVHFSHVELYKMGQAQLGRYPFHWHFCWDIGRVSKLFRITVHGFPMIILIRTPNFKVILVATKILQHLNTILFTMPLTVSLLFTILITPSSKATLDIKLVVMDFSSKMGTKREPFSEKILVWSHIKGLSYLQTKVNCSVPMPKRDMRALLSRVRAEHFRCSGFRISIPILMIITPSVRIHAIGFSPIIASSGQCHVINHQDHGQIIVDRLATEVSKSRALSKTEILKKEETHHFWASLVADRLQQRVEVF